MITNYKDAILLRKVLKVIIPIILVITIGIYAIHWAFFDIQRIDGQELINEVVSPDGKYTVSAYLNNGGTTTDYAVLCSVRNNETDKAKNIYWKYHCTEAEIEWIDEKTIAINGVELNVTKDTYDYRND